MGDLIQAPPWKKWVIISFEEDQMHLSKVGLFDWYDDLVLQIAAPTSTLLGPKNSVGSTPLYVAAIVSNEGGVEILVGRNRDLMSDKNKEDHSYGNNLLHLVGRLVPTNILNLISRASLQIQRELLWFKEVERFVCPLNEIHERTLEERLLYRYNIIRCPELDL